MEPTTSYESRRIGENDILPQTISFQFAAARGKEVQVMRNTLSSSMIYATKMAFQRLPTYMRRRAMSHNVKRLPRRVREIHKSQVQKSGLPQKVKNLRKYVRRPFNLQSEYVKRRRRVIWLDTHIWHAKRFKMIEKWGFRLPYTPCDRSFRACYRATKQHCLIQDISYYRCIEICGNYNKIVDKFKLITDPKNGLTIGAKIYKNGKKEGSVFLYKYNSNKCIGKVNFMWKSQIESEKSSIWLWVHPAFYSEVFETIIKTLELENSMDVDVNNIHFNKEFEVSELGSSLTRFKLSGPLSMAVLQNCFMPFEQNLNEQVDWLDNYKNKFNHDSIFNDQVQLWKSLKHVASESYLHPHTIISLVVRDPRYNLPKKRTKALPDYVGAQENLFDVTKDISTSPIWDDAVRVAVKEGKIPNSKINEMREELLVPGSDLEQSGFPIPVVLIQRPGIKTDENRGCGRGWDVILPGGWAQPFWIALIMWGARSAGLHEEKMQRFEMGLPDLLEPDTEAGIQSENDTSAKCKEVFFKRPPNKRTNFNKFSISSPFNWDWKLLLSEWNADNADFSVLRDKQILKNLQEMINSKNSNDTVFQYSPNFLVPVKITVKKGLFHKFAIICLTKDKDLTKEPVEPKVQDLLQQKRKDLRNKHIKLLKLLRKRRIRAKRNGKEVKIEKEMLEDYKKQMRSLWLPEAKTIRHSCSREVIGFIKFGDFSFSLGKCSAIGYITMGSIPSLLKQTPHNKVLLRNTNSLIYRLGTLQIICE